MDNLLKQLDHKKQELDQYRPLPADLIQNIDDWLKVELTYSSNAIEGNTLSRLETAEVIEKGIHASIPQKPLKDQLEAINHAKAVDFIRTLSKSLKSHQYITEKNILDIHKIILAGIDDINAGRYRQRNVFIKGSDIEFPAPQLVPLEIRKFMTWLEAQQDNHPVIIAAQAHYRYVSIHPFIDGNGRTSRLLMNLILLINSWPLTIIRNEDRTQYLEAIYQAQKKHDPIPFYTIITNAVDRSLDAYLSAVKGKGITSFFMEKGEHTVKLLTIGKLAQAAGVPIPTVRYYLNMELIKSADKTPGGFFLFDHNIIERIQMIKKLQNENRLTIAEIKQRLG